MKFKQCRFYISIIISVVLLVTGAIMSEKLSAESKKMTLAALGDCILSKRVSVKKEAAFLKLVDLIRSADCTWANCELPIVDIHQAYPKFRETDIPGAAPLFVADELQWLGVDLVGLANNHTMDYGHEGLFSTIENLERVGIGYAGAGRDLEEAARPRYVDTSGGRVGQVNCCGSLHWGTHASLTGPYVNGRPGLNPLRREAIIQIKKEDFVMLKKIFDEVDKHFISEDRQKNAEGQESEDPKKESGDKEKQKKPQDEIKFRDFKIVPGEAIADVSTLNKDDLKRITDAVKTARRNARIVIVSNHDHIGSHQQTQPTKAFEIYAKACIDAGADVVFNTGPHLLWGIEIYKGKPIFYSLGNFFFQIDADQFSPETYLSLGFPHDIRDGSLFLEKVHKLYFSKRKYWQGFVPFITFEKGHQVTAITLYPITLNPDKPLYEEGYPLPASPKEGKEIIAGLARMSKPYKTNIQYRDGVGTVKLK